MDTYDVVVIGAGAMGSAAARALAVAGREVLVLEQYEVLGPAAAMERWPGMRFDSQVLHQPGRGSRSTSATSWSSPRGTRR